MHCRKWRRVGHREKERERERVDHPESLKGVSVLGGGVAGGGDGLLETKHNKCKLWW